MRPSSCRATLARSARADACRERRVDGGRRRGRGCRRRGRLHLARRDHVAAEKVICSLSVRCGTSGMYCSGQDHRRHVVERLQGRDAPHRRGRRPRRADATSSQRSCSRSAVQSPIEPAKPGEGRRSRMKSLAQCDKQREGRAFSARSCRGRPAIARRNRSWHGRIRRRTSAEALPSFANKIQEARDRRRDSGPARRPARPKTGRTRRRKIDSPPSISCVRRRGRPCLRGRRLPTGVLNDNARLDAAVFRAQRIARFELRLAETLRD